VRHKRFWLSLILLDLIKETPLQVLSTPPPLPSSRVFLYPSTLLPFSLLSRVVVE
jgi:hypothetical protein